MQYDSIILELMMRIKKLEEEVAELKQIVSNQCIEQENRRTECDEEEEEIENTEDVKSRKKMTDEMIVYCYECGKKMHSGANIKELVKDISEKTGMNSNSAIMYLYAVDGMLNGTVFKRAISAKAIRMYFDMIAKEDGSAGLRRAIRATRAHIEYRIACGHKVDSLEEICNEAKKNL